MKDVIVLIPVYQDDLSKDEIYSFNRCLDILLPYDIGIVAPYSLNLPQIINGRMLPIYRFHDSFFEGIYGYNRLMLSREFYLRYIDYQYILIYQLDAIVFLNELMNFVMMDYDYIGAPWLHGMSFSTKFSGTILGRFVASFYNRCHHLIYKDLLYVGNGGLSLRKVAPFLDILNRFHKMSSSYCGNEDAFFSWIGMNFPQLFKVAPLEIALQFSFETYPRECYEMNGRRIPFGCHAWKKYDPDFIDELIARSEWRK